MTAAFAVLVIIALVLEPDRRPETLLTASLVGITGYYAVQTRQQVDVLRAQLADDRRAQRHRRDASVASVIVASIERSPFGRLIDFTQPNGLLHGAGELHLALEQNGPLLSDEELRRRVRVASALALTFTYGDLEERRHFAMLHCEQVILDVRAALQEFIREDDVHEWPEDFPSPPSVLAWLVDRSKRGEMPDGSASE